MAAEAVQAVGQRAAVVAELLRGASDQAHASAVGKAFEQHRVQREQRRVLVVGGAVASVELEPGHGIELEPVLGEQPGVGHLRHEGPVVQAWVGERVRIVLAGGRPDIEAECHVLGLGEVVSGDDRREVDVEQVRRGVLRAAGKTAGVDVGRDLGPDVRQREAGGKVPCARAGVPDLHHGCQRERDLAIDAQRRLAGDGHVAAAADRAIEVDLADIDSQDRLGGNDAGVGRDAGTGHGAPQRAFGGVGAGTRAQQGKG
ncbi:hypothetical protein D3C72_1373950 [compost metagenome]